MARKAIKKRIITMHDDQREMLVAAAKAANETITAYILNSVIDEAKRIDEETNNDTARIQTETD